MTPFWCACWTARQTRTNSADQLHDEVGPPGKGGAGVVHSGNIVVVHHCEGLALGFKAGDHLAGVHAGLDDLQRYLPAHRVRLLGHEDNAHAPFADLLQ
jgi:hypothetical protein